MDALPIEQYPRNLLEFEKQFGTEQACREYLFKFRWPKGFRCVRCGSPRAWVRKATGLMECAGCGYKSSVTSGTIFDRTRIPLRLWFRAMWLVTHAKNGASALSIQQQLGLTRYETAWTILHKLRRAMVRPGRDRLCGTVEVDETYLGANEEGVRGRQTYAKSLLAVAVEEDGKGIGRIRLATHYPRCLRRILAGLHYGLRRAGFAATYRRLGRLRGSGNTRLSALCHQHPPERQAGA